MLSGHGQARNIVEAMRLGATDFLRKPFEVEELELAFQKALEKRALKQEVERLRGRARSETELLLLFGDNPKMRQVRDIIEQVADTDITVLVRGESGTGKELVARTIFQLSSRRDRPFVKVNCAALPSELLESELFGFEKGAFTGAQKRKLGKFEYANQGTIFLDEISEMHPNLQAKLLQVLQDGEFSRLGGESDVHVDTRIIAATNRNLEEAVADGSLPRGPLLPAQRRHGPHAAAARAAGFDPAARRSLPAEEQRAVRQEHEATLQRDHGSVHALPLAGQRPRAREHGPAHGRARERAGGARGDLVARPRARGARTGGRRSCSTSKIWGQSSTGASRLISRRSRGVPLKLPRKE